MIKNQYMFPRIDDLFDQMKGTTVFSKIDFKLGYHYLWIKEENITKTTFKARLRNYDFTKIIPMVRRRFFKDSKSDHEIAEEKQEFCMYREMGRRILKDQGDVDDNTDTKGP
jgi:hypothetical protein